MAELISVDRGALGDIVLWAEALVDVLRAVGPEWAADQADLITDRLDDLTRSASQDVVGVSGRDYAGSEALSSLCSALGLDGDGHYRALDRRREREASARGC